MVIGGLIQNQVRGIVFRGRLREPIRQPTPKAARPPKDRYILRPWNRTILLNNEIVS